MAFKHIQTRLTFALEDVEILGMAVVVMARDAECLGQRSLKRNVKGFAVNRTSGVDK